MYPSDANNCLNSDIWLEKDSQEEYGCHTAQFNNNLREKICIHCDQRKPTSLEELAFSVILENVELLERFESALGHLPRRICWFVGRAINANLFSLAWKLVGIVSEYGETRPSWFGVDKSKTVFLTRFLLYCDVYKKLKPYLTSGSVGIHKILQYLSDVDSTYEDFWFTMSSAITKLKSETVNEDFKPLNGIICADKNNVVLVKARELTGKISTDNREYESMKKLQRQNKRFACPVIFKPTAIGLSKPKSRAIPKILDDIDTEMIVDVHLDKRDWSVRDIDKLGRVFSACTNLSSIQLKEYHPDVEMRDGMSAAISGMLSHHHRLQEIGLVGFNLIGELAMYPLPPVDNLHLRYCMFADEDLSYMAKRSDLALKSLVVTSYFSVHFPSLSDFIQNQAKSLIAVELEYPYMTFAEICHLLRIMAKFNKLEVLTLYCREEIDFSSIEKIIVDLMSIQSTRKFFIDIPTTSDVNGFDAERNHLIDVVKETCKINRRPPIELLLKIWKTFW